MFPISRAVRARLGSNAALTGVVASRIYPEARAQGAASPSVVFSVSEEETQPGLSATGFRKAKVEVMVVADTAASASEVGELVYTAMHGWTGSTYTTGGATPSTVVILHCLHARSLTNYQPPASGETAGTFMYSSIFSLMYA